ncbi:hypothetical protein CDL12_14564 [Handroanthus impetiginosus]|uniref:Uncharacterized protein n=1 Tax=Handroanthus impetiginosus TaxID=429701 RepID=A0A2G9H5M6_9LAMI|nr:hypothetical protein CDL12_14564 [Handroanthus impetiginosus]
MASQEDLIRIGMEGFAIVDKYFEKNERQRTQGSSSHGCPYHGCLYQYQPQKSHIYHVKPVSAAKEMIVHYRDGVPIMDYSKGKSRAVAY